VKSSARDQSAEDDLHTPHLTRRYSRLAQYFGKQMTGNVFGAMGVWYVKLQFTFNHKQMTASGIRAIKT